MFTSLLTYLTSNLDTVINIAILYLVVVSALKQHVLIPFLI